MRNFKNCLNILGVEIEMFPTIYNMFGRYPKNIKNQKETSETNTDFGQN